MTKYQDKLSESVTEIGSAAACWKAGLYTTAQMVQVIEDVITDDRMFVLHETNKDNKPTMHGAGKKIDD